ncbi:MAG: hypothetical protein ACK4WH_06935 [Phycisphaerales bacterium]
MALIYCGIDEAGYGPLLGPLCVGMSAFSVEGWREGDPAPDLWKLLSSAVCREASDKRRRIAVDDSKKLKLANSSVRRHPLHHLERGVLAFLAARRDSPCPSFTSDHELLAALGVRLGTAGRLPGWYDGLPAPIPIGSSQAEIAIAANTLRLALDSAGIAVLSLAAEAVGESSFNELVEAAGTKAAVTESVLVRFLADVWTRFAAVPGAGPPGRDGVRVVCDRQGGRTQYGGLLARAFPEAAVSVVVESPAHSKYQLRAPGRAMSVSFRVEAESAHLPVALASMLAKLTRELMMARFNRYWCNRIPELKPTAGYALDARRWLRDAHDDIHPDERRSLIRRA